MNKSVKWNIELKTVAKDLEIRSERFIEWDEKDWEYRLKFKYWGRRSRWAINKAYSSHFNCLWMLFEMRNTYWNPFKFSDRNPLTDLE